MMVLQALEFPAGFGTVSVVAIVGLDACLFVKTVWFINNECS